MLALISLSSGMLPPTSKTTVPSFCGTLAWKPMLAGLDGDSTQNAELLLALSYFLIQTETVMTSFDAVGFRKLALGINAEAGFPIGTPKSRSVTSLTRVAALVRCYGGAAADLGIITV